MKKQSAKRPGGRMKDASDRDGNPGKDHVAIIGMGCRFPQGVHDMAAFWDMLATAADCTVPPPEDRFDVAHFYHPTPKVPGKMYNRCGGYLTAAIDQFDRKFFRMPPLEAAHLDPQVRLLLEVSLEALEDAGIPPDHLRGSNTGVYTGVTSNEYTANVSHPADNVSAYSNSGTNSCMISNRISYEFDLRGPSFSIDTACSSSLYAIHLACEALRQGNCDVALAGGVNLLLQPYASIGFSQAQMLSPDGKCKSFDAKADGYARSEGAGMIVLKPLAAALTDRDPIYAVIRGGALSNDGKTQGIAQPSYDAQVSLVDRAYKNAGVSPHQVTFIEAHGTGTKAGDRTEANALGQAMGRCRGPNQPPLYLGSVKSNMGHTEGAAGVAGVIKAALMLSHRKIVPVAHFRTPNPEIKFNALRLKVPTSLTQWPWDDRFGLAGCSSFGFGGANAHIVLEKSPVRRVLRQTPSHIQQQNVSDANTANISPELLVLSAASPSALQQHAENWITYLAQVPTNDTERFRDILFSASVRSQHHSHRLALVVRNPRDAQRLLQDFVDGKAQTKNTFSGVVTDTDATPALVFVFSGMGTQWWAMARQLLIDEQIFADKIKEVARLLKQCGARWSLVDVLMSSQEDSLLDQTEIAQPTIFAVEVALAELLRTVGIVPSVVVGHSVGEVAAAQIAGALSLEQAVRVIYNRGRQLRKTCGQGTMLAALSTLEAVEKHLPLRQTNTSDDERLPQYENIDIAAVNSPSQVVLSGTRAALEPVADSLTQEGSKAVFLRVNNAFHSYQQAPLRETVMRKLNGLKPQENGGQPIPMMSTVTAKYVVPDEVASSGYWWSNIRGQVKFQQTIERLIDEGLTHFLEIGAHSALTPAVKDIAVAKGMGNKVIMLPTLKRPRDIAQPADDRENLLGSLGGLYVNGVCFDFSALYPPAKYNFRPLPLYPWQRETCWTYEDELRKRVFPVSSHLLLGEHQPSYTTITDPSHDASSVMAWKCKYSIPTVPWLLDHVIQDSIIVPAAAYVETCYQAAKQITKTTAFRLKNIKFEHFMFANGGNATVVTVAKREGPSLYSTKIYTQEAAGTWQRHSEASVEMLNSEELSKPRSVDVEKVKRRCPHFLNHDQFYAMMNSDNPSDGFNLGPSFRGVSYAHSTTNKNETLTFVEATDEIAKDLHRFNCHPALMDTILQTFAVNLVDRERIRREQIGLPPGDFVQVPHSIGCLEFYGPVPSKVWVHATTTNNGSHIASNLQVIDPRTGHVVFKLTDLTFTPLSQKEEGQPHFWFLERQYITEMSLKEDVIVKGDKRMAVIETGDSVGQRLVEQLNNEGVPCQLFDLTTLQDFPNVLRQDDVSRILINASSATDIVIVLAGDYSQPNQEATDLQTMTRSSFEAAQRRSLMVLLYTIQYVAKQQAELFPNIWILTKGTSPVHRNDKIDPLMSSVTGIALTMSYEHPDIPVTLIDLPMTTTDDVYTSAAVRYLSNPPVEETEVTLVPSTDGESVSVYAARLNESPESELVGDGRETKWTMEMASRSKGYVIKAGNRVIDEQCADNSIIVKVDCFVPISTSHSTSSAVPQKVAGWFSGIAVKRGYGVDALTEGCGVTGLCSEVGSYIHLPAADAIPKPTSLTHSEAVGIARDLLPPWRSFVIGAKCNPGDMVVVYVNEDSSSMAACQVAKCLRANVVAVVEDDTVTSMTATDSLLVKRSELGTVTNEMKARFGRDKADVLFLGHSFIEDNKDLVKLLKPFGSVIVYSTLKVGSLSDINDSLQVIHVNSNAVTSDGQPKSDVARSFGEFMKSIEVSKNGWTSKDSLPLSVSALKQQQDNRSALSQSEPIVRIDQPVVASLPSDPQVFRLSPDETYVVTGGLKGFGLALTEWLVDRGATCLAVIGRSAPSQETKLKLDTLRRNSGATIYVVQADVTDEAQMETAFDEIEQRMPPLTGIFHCAAVYADDWLSKLTENDFLRVLFPKSYGAILLHQQTVKRNIQLKYFVLFSSTVSLFGNSGQGNYCAANTLLNALTHYRRQRGLVATAIQYGPIGQVGFLADKDQLLDQWYKRGMAPIHYIRALETLGRVLCLEPTHVGIQCHSDAGIGSSTGPWFFTRGVLRFSRIKGLPPPKAIANAGSQHGSVLSQTTSREDRLSAVTNTTQQWLEDKFGSGDIGPDAALVSLGLDSILASELSNALHAAFQVIIPPVRLLNDQCTIVTLAEIVVKAAEQLDKTSTSQNAGGATQSEGPQSSSRWISIVNQPTSVKMKLVCFPPNAGGVQSFANWDTLLQSHDVEMLVVQPPGWLNREREQCMNELDELVGEATQVLLPHIQTGPFVFYGHSMGALLAYEVACQLRDNYSLSPRHLMVGAWYAPHLPYPHPEDYNIPTAIFHPSTPLDVILKYAASFTFIKKTPKVFKEQDAQAIARFRNLVLPCIEAGLHICKRYVGDRRRLPCGITAFSGKKDNFVGWEAVNAWREHAASDRDFKHLSFSAGHFFLHSHYRDILSVLRVLPSAGPQTVAPPA